MQKCSTMAPFYSGNFSKVVTLPRAQTVCLSSHSGAIELKSQHLFFYILQASAIGKNRRNRDKDLTLDETTREKTRPTRLLIISRAVQQRSKSTDRFRHPVHHCDTPSVFSQLGQDQTRKKIMSYRLMLPRCSVFLVRSNQRTPNLHFTDYAIRASHLSIGSSHGLYTADQLALTYTLLNVVKKLSAHIHRVKRRLSSLLSQYHIYVVVYTVYCVKLSGKDFVALFEQN